MNDANPTPPRGRRRRNLLMRRTLAGLPELEHFASEEERQAAIDELGDEAGNLRSWSFWLAVLTLGAGVWLANGLANWLLRRVIWPRLLEEALVAVATVGSLALVLRWLHRRGTGLELRRKLLARGIPVCEKCGYLLRGLPASSERCPECGETINAQARAILSAGNAPADQSNTPT